MSVPKRVHTLVLDSGPILKNDPAISTLMGQSEVLATVPSVIAEIRDATARSRIELSLLPFLMLREPKPESLKMIVDFARKTGDHVVLSRTDLQVLALSYELECERNGGDWRLRGVPGQKRMNGPPPRKTESPCEITLQESSKADQAGSTTATSKSDGAGPDEKVECEFENPVTSAVTSQVESLSQALDTTHLSEPALDKEDVSVTPTGPLTEPASDESDSDGWITPSNIKRHQSRELASSTKPSSDQIVLQVATITTDFAMQNVLMQMNLNLLSPSLQRVRHLKTFTLRCHACFEKTKDMQKQFCPRCGKPTLMRVSCSTLENGEFRLHLKKNVQWNTRGDRFSMPKPVNGSANGRVNVGGGGKGGGKGGWGQSLLLAEDQKEYQQAMKLQERGTARDLMDEDYLPGILTGERGRAGGRPKVGGGRNINSRKRK